MAINILFQAININAMETDTGVFVGENNQFGWDSHQKQNSGLGFIFGFFNSMPFTYNLISDNEMFDTNINDQDIKVGANFQSL